MDLKSKVKVINPKSFYIGMSGEIVAIDHAGKVMRVALQKFFFGQVEIMTRSFFFDEVKEIER